MKKNTFNFLALVALILAFSLVLAGCGPNPKALAKEAYNIMIQQQAMMEGPVDFVKAAELKEKADNNAKKVGKLSNNDVLIFWQELARLTQEGR